MKVSLNIKFISGPYGGGMQFANYLKKFLQNKGIEVINHLKDNNIDIILHVSPFPYLSPNASYSFFDAYIYKLKHPQTKIIFRINECDERKNTNYINKEIIKASKYVDFLVYIASWLKPLLEEQGLNKNLPSQIILNGADENIFNLKEKNFWDGKGKLKIVTHHWSNNFNKGHNIYQQLDKLLENNEFAKKFEFTYIGNYPKNLIYKRTKLIPPLAGKELARELKKHHIYITASKNEPAGMHHIEAALCGLPILYINSGALPEYCQEIGLEFNGDNLENKLNELYNNYNLWIEKVKNYKRTAKNMAQEFYELFLKLYPDKSYELQKNTCLRISRGLWVKIYGLIYILKWRISHRLVKLIKIKILSFLK